MVPLSRRRSRKGINQGPNKTRFSPDEMGGKEGRRKRRRGKRKERSGSRSTKTRQNTNYFTANTPRTRAGIPRCQTRPDGGIILGKGRGARAQERARGTSSALRRVLAKVRQKRRRFDVYENETVIVKEFTARGGAPPPPPPPRNLPLAASFATGRDVSSI